MLAHTPTLPSEVVLIDGALGRVLAEDVAADHDLPPFDRAAMDGYAVRAADVASAPVVLDVVGPGARGPVVRSSRGHRPGRADDDGGAGAVGATAVMPVEKTRASDGGRRVELLATAEPGAHIARAGLRGARRATTVLSAGDTMDPAAIGVLAAVGRGRVARRPPSDGRRAGHGRRAGRRLGHARPRRASATATATRSRPRRAGPAPTCARSASCPTRRTASRRPCARASRSDVLLISGGVSAGAYDLVEDVLARFDVGPALHAVAVKPGAPARVRPPRRPPRLRPARQPRLRAGHVRRCSCARRCCACRARASSRVRRCAVDRSRRPSRTARAARAYSPARVRFEGGRLRAGR